MADVVKHKTDVDHEAWMRCFTAALVGVFPAREPQSRPDPRSLVTWCGEIADAALEEEIKRRKIEGGGSRAFAG